MTTKRLVIRLNDAEHQRLQLEARQNCRKPNQQARFLLLSGLGLVNSDPTSQTENNTGACEFADRSASVIHTVNQF